LRKVHDLYNTQKKQKTKEKTALSEKFKELNSMNPVGDSKQKQV
jgi:hypothetical protein